METLVIDTELKGKITNAIQKVLIQQFETGNKTTLRDMHGRLTFACPYCGDSTKDSTKKRGNLFWDSLFYHCFNDGCNVHKNLSTFLKDFKARSEINGTDRLKIIDYINENRIEYDDNSFVTFDLFEKITKLAIPLKDFYRFTRSTPIYENSEGYSILRDRLLIHKSTEFSYSKDKLFILNLTRDRGHVIGYQIRHMNSKNGNRYSTYNLDKLRGQCNLPSSKFELNISDVESDKLNKLSTIFNILNIDFTKEITIFEGPIDSKFISNSIGMSTVGRDTSMFDDIPYKRYFLDNDKAGIRKSIELLKSGEKIFLWKKFIEDHKLLNNLPEKFEAKFEPIKDLNDVIEICYLTKNNAFKEINKYFSKSSFDLVYV